MQWGPSAEQVALRRPAKPAGHPRLPDPGCQGGLGRQRAHPQQAVQFEADQHGRAVATVEARRQSHERARYHHAREALRWRRKADLSLTRDLLAQQQGVRLSLRRVARSTIPTSFCSPASARQCTSLMPACRHPPASTWRPAGDSSRGGGGGQAVVPGASRQRLGCMTTPRA